MLILNKEKEIIIKSPAQPQKSKSLQDKSRDIFYPDLELSIISEDIQSMINHNKSYDRILELYIKSVEENMSAKKRYKRRFSRCCNIILYSISATLLLSLICIMIMTFKYPHIDFNIQNIIAVISAISVAFVSSFMIIPKMITQYLFNLNEEDNVRHIIKNIQEHDLTIRKSIHHDNDDSTQS